MASDAVIFVPGIKGTKLVETNRTAFDTIWSGVQSNFESIQDLELTKPSVGKYYDHRIDSIIQPGEIEELAYAEFLSDLTTDKPVFIFNYDWRYSARKNGEDLAEFIDYLVAKSRATPETTQFKKFDIITHSLGNHIVRSYLLKKGFARVNRIVFTVPPFRGAVDIVTAALIGEGWFPNIRSKMRKIIRTLPGALELLPAYEDASQLVPDGAHSFLNFKHWQSNTTSPENSASEKLKKALGDAKKTIKNELLDLADLSQAERSRILVICRTGFPTWQSVSVQKEGPGDIGYFVDFEKSCRNDHGDGRVPHISSCCYWDSVLTLMLKDAFWYRDYSHGFVLKDERAQKLVNRFFSDDESFSYQIPGGSIGRVVDLEPKTDEETELPYWEALYE